MKKVFISGINGQDGSYLAEYLIGLKEYEVHGMIRRHSVAESQDARIAHLSTAVHTHYGDLLDPGSINKMIHEIQPDYIVNLAAQSHVRISFDMPIFTMKVVAEGALHMLEAFRSFAPHARYYQAASSEQFGNSIEPGGIQNENTPMHPVSPYGCSKLAAYHFTRHYRKAYGLFACNGILFNHTSRRRGENFVVPKIVKGALEIYAGKRKELFMGNLDSYRDWGFSGEYVKAMWKVLNHTEPDDFVIASGESHSIREICKYVFNRLGMDYQDYVKQDPQFLRADELKYLRGDATKAQNVLGWKNETTFTQILDDIIAGWAEKLSIPLPEIA